MKKLFVLFSTSSLEEDNKRFHAIYLILLMTVILAGWGYFLNWGNIPFDFHDWAEINAPRLAFLKDAVTKGKLPLHMPDASALRSVTDRYLALPDIIISPQVILLRWMSVGTFVLIDTWLMIGLGYWGLLKLKKRFSLSLLTFTWIALLFFFNGHMLSHYSIGHITWGGTFLFSLFAELVFALIDGERGAKWEAKMAFLLFFIFLQGSFHQFVWCVLFLGFLAISTWKTFFPILRAGIAAALLSAVRIIPPALLAGSFNDEFLGGYGQLIQVVNAFVKILSPADAFNQARTGSVQGWWEYDIYISIFAVLILIAALIAWLRTRESNLGFPSLICPVTVLTILSYQNCYQVIRFFRIPLFTGERISSRFLILPFIFVLAAGMTALQRLIHNRSIRFGNVLLTALLIPCGIFLFMHLNTWKVTEAVKYFPYTYTDLSIKTVANHPDQPYTTGLLIGAIISTISGILIVFRAWKKNR